MNIKASAALGTLALATLTAVDVILYNKNPLTSYKFKSAHSFFTCSGFMSSLKKTEWKLTPRCRVLRDREYNHSSVQ